MYGLIATSGSSISNSSASRVDVTRAPERNISPNGTVVAMPGQDMNIAPLKFLAE